MNYAAIFAAVCLAFALLPQPMLMLDVMYHRALARSIARASAGSIDVNDASERIRRAERWEPIHSARVFAALAFGAGCVIGAASSSSIIRVVLVAVLSAISGLLLIRGNENPRALVLAAITGAVSILSIL